MKPHLAQAGAATSGHRPRLFQHVAQHTTQPTPVASRTWVKTAALALTVPLWDVGAGGFLSQVSRISTPGSGGIHGLWNMMVG